MTCTHGIYLPNVSFPYSGVVKYDDPIVDMSFFDRKCGGVKVELVALIHDLDVVLKVPPLLLSRKPCHKFC